MSDLKMYVWEDVLRDYTAGIVAVAAESEAAAWDQLYEDDPTAWWVIQGRPTAPVDYEYDGDGTKADLVKSYFDSIGKTAADTATEPVEVTDPSTFVVWGGG